jgi:hypothetical protein
MNQEREDYADADPRRTTSPGTLALVAVLATFAGIAVAVLAVIALFVWWIQPFVGFN